MPFYPVTAANPRPRDDQKWWAYGNVWPLVTDGIPPFQFQGYANNYDLVPVWPNQGGAQTIGAGFTQNKTIGGIQYEICAGVPAARKGRYYLETTIGGQRMMSDVFTIVPDLTPYLKIEWWDDKDFIMDSGVIIYADNLGTNIYKNILYLQSDLAKPDYIFEEEGETRDGYFFPIKQISEKRYKFTFLAPEYVLDIMRFIRMSDHIKITYRGQEYYPDTFLITPSWEPSGQLASVICEFDTDTVAKKIGRLPQVVTLGNFNNDFNDDFNN